MRFAAVFMGLIFSCNICAAETLSEQTQRLNAESDRYYANRELNNETLMSALWIEKSAEYRALCYQAYNAAKTQIDSAVNKRKKKDKPLAIITDIDEAILNNNPFDSMFIDSGTIYDRDLWIKWCESASAEAMVGAVECLQYIASKGVEIFYISNRHADTELDGTIENLKKLGFPMADKDHMIFKTATSDKKSRFDIVAKNYDVVFYIGDSVGDFPLDAYGKNYEERNAIIDNNSDDFGKKFIMLPNPKYGDWENSIAPNYRQATAREKENIRRDSFKVFNAYENSISNLLADSQTAQKTDQIILVVDHNLSLWNKTVDGWKKDFETFCGYGRNGFNIDRHEGDATTPIGAFPILYSFGTGDNPGTSMDYKKITPNSYFSGESSTYNTWVESPYRISGEHLSDYYQYTYAMNIGFNINPTIVGKGSAIFLHCKSIDRWWTAGCVSIESNYMLDLLKKSHNGEWIIIVPKVDDIVNY